MTTRNLQYTVHPALGGLDISSDATVLDPNFAVVSDNVEYREGGQRKRRPGFRVYSSDPDAPPQVAGSRWTHEVAARSNTTFPTASVFVDDLTVYAFYAGAVQPRKYDVSTDGGKTFPTTRATAVAASTNDMLQTFFIGGTRFLCLQNDSKNIVYSDNVLTLPTTSTWTEVQTPSSVGAPVGIGQSGNTVLVATQDGGGALKVDFSTDAGTTWTAATTHPADTVTTPFTYQIFANPSVGVWVLLNPKTGKIFRSTDSGANWSLITTLTAGDVTLSSTGCIIALSSTRLIACYKGQIYSSETAGTIWIAQQNLTLTNNSPDDIRQGQLVSMCSFGLPLSNPVLGAFSTYVDTFNNGVTKQASWISQDLGSTWQIQNVYGGSNHGSSSVAMTGFIGRAGRGVADMWNSGAAARDSWFSLAPIPVSLVSTAASVRAIEDFWKYGASLTPTQQFVAVAGASIFASTGQGNWNMLTASSSFGSDSNRTTNIVLAGDYAVVSDGVSVPVAYDQTGFTSTALVTPQSIQSNIPRTVSLVTSAAANTITITTTNLFSYVSTGASIVTISSTGDLQFNSSGFTNPSTSPSTIFTSTTAVTVTPVTTITTTFGLTTTTPVLFTQASTGLLFQSLVNGWSSVGSTQVTFTSTNQFSVWPKFTHASYHLNRMFYQGISTAPSNVGYTAASNIFDSTGSDTGTFPVNVGDGDQVMALSKPFYGSLYVYKGPQKGSVWQLSGNTPATFALVPVSHGAPILNARALVTTPTDIYWLSQYGIHSLQTTVKFGNVEEAFLSLPIQKLWRDSIIKRTTLNEAWGFWHPQRNIVGWAVQPEGETTQHWLLCYNYALSDPKPGGKKFWSIWKLNGFASLSGAIMLVTSLDASHQGEPHLWVGGNTGFVYEGDQDTQDSDFFDAGQAYTYQVRTPTITKFKGGKGQDVPETQEKVFQGVVTYFVPKGSGSQATLTVTVDGRPQTYSVPFQGGGATLD